MTEKKKEEHKHEFTPAQIGFLDLDYEYWFVIRSVCLKDDCLVERFDSVKAED